MSQATLLEKVTEWSVETCRQELGSVLPKLLSMYHRTSDWDECIRVLKILTEMFLPHLNLADLEEECFSKVLPKVDKVFSDLMEEIASQIGGLTSQNTELRALLRNALQMMVQVLETLSGCVRHVCSFEESLALDTIRSLPSCILKVLKNTFQYCKESETVYNGRLSLVVDLLQALFKEAYSLQKGLMELLDRISLDSSATEEDACDMVIVIHSLLDICSIISNLDITLHANTWKFIIKQSIKYQGLLEERLRHSDIVCRLCDDLLASFHSCMELAEQMKQSGAPESSQSVERKFFQKTAKMCRFFANTLVHYIKEFKPYLSKSCGRLHHLYLQMYSKFPPSVYAPVISDAHCNEINSVILVAMDPLITHLLPFRPFAEVVLAETQQFGPELVFPQCLLLVNIMDKLPSLPEEVLNLWFQGSQFHEETPRLPVFQALFLSFQQCSTERAVPILVPGVMMNGQAQSQVTLHQHACVHLSACIASLPPAYFPQLEHTLLTALLCPDAQTALLAADAWCFLVRYGTAELCQHHVTLVSHLIKSCPGDCYQLSQLTFLLRRMFVMMTPNHQIEFVEKFSSREPQNLCIWQHVPLREFALDVRKRVEDDIVKSAIPVCTSWLDGGCKLGQLEKVNTALSAVLSVFRDSGDAVEEAQLQAVSRLLAQLWMRMSVSQVLSQPAVQCTLRLLLLLSVILVQSMEPQVLPQALTCLSSLLPLKCPDDIVLAALDFLASLGEIFLPPEIQSQVLPKLASLFSALLTDGSWLLQHHTLEAFAHFVEATNHEEVIPQCLPSEEIKTKVVNFLSKNVPLEENREARLERLKLQSSVIERPRDRLESGAVEAAGDLQPCPKRARQQTSEEEQYETSLQAAESALKTLQTLMAQTPPPQWVVARLQELETQITRINAVQRTGA
ncbi:FIGNL1-interacting regulator of recombination and mitosis [Amia ocellicauda]|uniref:FIGNL1-interacting regulator of recombination and mitosis n=1 Tax=Amia ocellicauda TaxID=2972642 RepID=UPI00346402CA